MNYKVSPNIPVPIEVTYPDGDEIGIMVDKIRVFVGAKSETPISWTGKIEVVICIVLYIENVEFDKVFLLSM